MRALVPARSLALVGAILLLGGCGGYRSAYVARPDGRARMGWAYGKLVAQMPPTGVQLCYRESGPGGTAPSTPQPGWGWPSAPSAPAASPSRPSGGGGGSRVWVPYVGPPPPGSSRYASESRYGGSEGGDSKGLAVGVAVGILVVMPLITGGLALDPPGIDDKVAGAMDDVNRYNDFMRRGAVPCAAVGVR